MNPSVITIEALSEDSDTAALEAARELLLEYGRFVLAAEGPARFCFGTLEEEANGLPGTYAGQRGRFLLARVDGQPAGCVTWRTLAAVPAACEMKRLWVRPALRGSGLGERLTRELFQQAVAAGFDALYLDTVPGTMGAAYRMYQRLGFVDCPPYHGNATAGMAFMRRQLGDESR